MINVLSINIVTCKPSSPRRPARLPSPPALPACPPRLGKLTDCAPTYPQMQAQRGLAAATDRAPLPGPPAAGRDYGAYRRTLTKLARRPSQPAEPPEPPSPGATELPILFESEERRGERGEREGERERGREKVN